MYKVTIEMTRPDANIPWFLVSRQMRSIMDLEKTNGNLISEEVSLSEDGLKKTYIAVWKDKKSYENFVFNDDLAYERHQRRIYNVKNNCNVSIVSVEEV
jgi:hypothetical protein